MNLEALVVTTTLIISSLACLVAAFFVWRSEHRYIFLSLLLCACAFWAFWTSIIYNHPSASNLSFGFSVGIFIPTFLYLFIASFLNKQHKILAIVMICLASILSVLCWQEGLMVKLMLLDGAKIVSSVPGVLYPFYIVPFIIFLIMSFYLIAKGFSVVRGIQRIQLFYIAFGSGLAISFGLIFSIVLPALNRYDYAFVGPLFMLFMAASMAYGVTKHYIYSFKVVFSELWAVALVLVNFLWLVTDTSVFHLFMFLFITSVSVLCIRSVISEANENILLRKQNLQLEKDKKDLQVLDRMKDEFLQMTTHELTTPVAFLRSKFSMIFDENFGDFGKEQKEFLKPMMLQSERLNKLFRQVVDVSNLDEKKISLDYSSVNSAKLIEGAIKEQIAEAGKMGKAVVFKDSNHLPDFQVDKVKLSSVIQSLLDNAIKFSSGEKDIIISAAVQGGYIRINIKDSGFGISKDDQPHIFEKFFQAKRFDKNNPLEQQGSGLSLYIAKKVIELHKGKIWFESEEKQGTTFSVLIPLEPAGAV
ncbi:MAG: ATP-binding protein [Patescibacteria group bacterium]